MEQLKVKRIQRKRTKGWRMPENTKCVNRGTKWGNPIKLMNGQIYIDAGYRRTILDKWVWLMNGDVDDVISLYEDLWSGVSRLDFDMEHWVEKFKQLDLSDLKGKNLACFCSTETPCHGDVLLKLANK
jgi:hypothetical protein